uniref:Uncharacterized protein n=1 Tax=Globodera rostochiensis TaxID=31243 RepID=A0A914H586_GLORO
MATNLDYVTALAIMRKGKWLVKKSLKMMALIQSWINGKRQALIAVKALQNRLPGGVYGIDENQAVIMGEVQV